MRRLEVLRAISPTCMKKTIDVDALDVRHNERERRFEAALYGSDLAIAEYRRREDRIIFTHTEVPGPYEGQGVGEKLVRTALDYARQEGLKVVPRCPFFAAFIRQHEAYQDLVAA